jgi:hypothetical protein
LEASAKWHAPPRPLLTQGRNADRGCSSLVWIKGIVLLSPPDPIGKIAGWVYAKTRKKDASDENITLIQALCQYLSFAFDTL